MSMSVGERDEKMNKMASIAAEAFCEKHTPVSDDHIKEHPEMFLEHTIPYLTVRTLHELRETLERQETALKSLEADSRWIRRLTFVLVGLTVVLANPDNRVAVLCFAFGHRTPSAIYRIASAITDSNDDAITDGNGDTMIEINAFP